MLARIKAGWERFEDVLGWPIDLLLRHFERRLFELAMTVAMIGVGITLIASPRSIEAGSFRFLVDAMPLWLCIFMFFGLGGARIIALILNGHWMPHGAYVRATGAVAGAIMWGQMCAALWPDAPISPSIPIYAALSLFEVVSFYFALVGVKRWKANCSIGH